MTAWMPWGNAIMPRTKAAATATLAFISADSVRMKQQGQ